MKQNCEFGCKIRLKKTTCYLLMDEFSQTGHIVFAIFAMFAKVNFYDLVIFNIRPSRNK